MQSKPQPEQITRTVVGITTVFIGGIALLSTVFVVPAGEVGVVTTLGKVSNTPRERGLNLKLPFIQSTPNFSVRTQVIPEKFSTLTKDLQVIEATATLHKGDQQRRDNTDNSERPINHQELFPNNHEQISNI